MSQGKKQIMAEEYNDMALRAWEKWKEICFVAGCPKEDRKCLQKEILSAFHKKFGKICPQNMEEIFSVNCSSNDEENVQEELSELENIVESPEDQNDSYTNFAASALTYWANEFDQGILAKAYAVPRAENEEEAEGDSRNGNIWI
jgi:hypothetical protein